VQVTSSIITRTAKIWLGKDGIVHLQPHARREQSLRDAIENVAAVAQVAEGTALPLLIHFQEAAPQTPECRSYYMSREACRTVSAVAVVTSSMLGRVIGNLMIGMNKTASPFKLFDTESSAAKWLNEVHAKRDRRPSLAGPPP
jgi:hypothetical protein